MGGPGGGDDDEAGGFTEINVTPLVDVMLVLLLVFMVAAPMMMVGVPVDLPRTTAARVGETTTPQWGGARAATARCPTAR